MDQDDYVLFGEIGNVIRKQTRVVVFAFQSLWSINFTAVPTDLGYSGVFPLTLHE